MAAMKLAGAEVDHQFSETFAEMIQDESLDRKMNARMMKQMETTWDDIEVTDEGLGFDDLSLERYRQDLLEEFNKDKNKYLKMPKGVYTGFKADKTICNENGIIALLGYPARPSNKPDYDYQLFDLIYINMQGKAVLLNQKEILDVELVNAVQGWLKDQAVEIEKQSDGTEKKVMGKEARDILAKLKRGDKDSLTRVKQNIKTNEKYQLTNFDLIAWFLVS
jgi:hypothetical protein